jgi:hypothetical protein
MNAAIILPAMDTGIIKQILIKTAISCTGVLPNKKIIKSNDDPYFIPRIKNDFLFRLPGINRKSLLSIYIYKLRRRISKEKVF